MDSACPKEHATEIRSDFDHLTKVAPVLYLKLVKSADYELMMKMINWYHLADTSKCHQRHNWVG